jgi:hypothetical protein
MREQISGAIFNRFQEVKTEYLEYSHSSATIAGLAAEGVEAWLKQEGLAVVKVGEIPPWMEGIGDICGRDPKRMPVPPGRLDVDACPADFAVYRLSPTAAES